MGKSREKRRRRERKEVRRRARERFAQEHERPVAAAPMEVREEFWVPGAADTELQQGLGGL